MSAKPTASSLQRAMECAASTVLPSVADWSEKAERGVCGHSYVERRLLGVSEAEALALVPEEWRGWCASFDIARIVDGLHDLRVEVPYAVDPFARTARTFTQKHERDYTPLTAAEFGGRGDIFGRTMGCPAYRDIKTGQDQGDLEDHQQCRFFAAALHLETGAPEVICSIVYIDVDASVRIKSATFTEMDFAVTLQALQRLHGQRERLLAEHAKGARLDVREGEWCRYCPAFTACPAKTSMAMALTDTVGSLSLTPETAAAAWVKFASIKGVYERVEKELKGYAREFGIALPNGKIVRPIDKSRTSINGERALSLLREHGVSEEKVQECIKRVEYSEVREVKR